jgi:HEPN domain-containing protein
LIERSIEFPYVHDIGELFTLLEKTGQKIPEIIKQADRLTRFAVFTRYPGIAHPISEDEYEEAIEIAQEVIRWVQERLETH